MLIKFTVCNIYEYWIAMLYIWNLHVNYTSGKIISEKLIYI